MKNKLHLLVGLTLVLLVLAILLTSGIGAELLDLAAANLVWSG